MGRVVEVLIGLVLVLDVALTSYHGNRQLSWRERLINRKSMSDHRSLNFRQKWAARRRAMHAGRSELPATVDWRISGCLTPVRSMGMCGADWAFTTTASLEFYNCETIGQLVGLSPQNLIDCSKAEGNQGCNGGTPSAAFEYVKVNHGLDTEASYPYTAREGICHFRKESATFPIKGYQVLKPDNESLLQAAVAEVGPVTAVINARAFRDYHGGIVDIPNCNATEVSESVLVVGYGTLNGTEYWLVRISLGWGDRGYGMIARNKGNMCGIATRNVYPIQ